MSVATTAHLVLGPALRLTALPSSFATSATKRFTPSTCNSLNSTQATETRARRDRRHDCKWQRPRRIIWAAALANFAFYSSKNGSEPVRPFRYLRRLEF